MIKLQHKRRNFILGADEVLPNKENIMKFKCDGLELSEAINVVSKAKTNKTTHKNLPFK